MLIIYPHALGAGAELDAPTSAMPWESLVPSPWESLVPTPQESWEAFLAQGWEKTVFARPPHSSVFVRPRPCSQGLCLGRSSPGGQMPVARTECARALGWGIHEEGMETGHVRTAWAAVGFHTPLGSLVQNQGRTQHFLTLPTSFAISHPGPSARSTDQPKQCKRTRTARPHASFAWSMWRRSCPTRLWCAPTAGRHGSIGAASRYEALPMPLRQGRCLAAVPRSCCLSLSLAATGFPRWAALLPVSPV